MSMVQRSKKEQNSFQILVHIRICNVLLSHQLFLFFPLRPFRISVRVCTDRGGTSIRPVYLSVRPSVHTNVWTCCVGCSLPVSCFLLPLVGGRGHSRKREQYAGQGRDSRLAMYTFMVGPRLPTNGSAISEGPVHTQIRPMRWLPLCPPQHSSKPQRFPPSLGNCGLKRPSVCSRCARICQRSRWPDDDRRG